MNRDGEYLIREANGGTRSRENGVASMALKAGELLGKLTSTGKYRPWDPAATNGSEVIAGIAHRHYDTNDRIRICARDAEVKRSQLIFPEGNDAAAEAGLADLGIIVR